MGDILKFIGVFFQIVELCHGLFDARRWRIGHINWHIYQASWTKIANKLVAIGANAPTIAALKNRKDSVSHRFRLGTFEHTGKTQALHIIGNGMLYEIHKRGQKIDIAEQMVTGLSTPNTSAGPAHQQCNANACVITKPLSPGKFNTVINRKDEQSIVFQSTFSQCIGDNLNGGVNAADGPLLQGEFPARRFVVN